MAENWPVARLTEADLPSVLELEGLAYRQPWTEENFRGEFRRRISYCLGVKAPAAAGPGAVLAHCFFWMVGPEIHLLNVAVRPEYRRRGLARRLLGAMLALGRRAGAEAVFLEVRAANEPAQALYRSLGFVAVGRRPDYYEDGEDAVLMNLTLPAGLSKA